jgi:hypothetical protein
MDKRWFFATAMVAVSFSTVGCVAQRATSSAARLAAASLSTINSAQPGNPVAAASRVEPATSLSVGSRGAPATSAQTSDAGRRPINATCPVLVGVVVDPRVTSEWKGVVVAFSDIVAKSAWDADSAAYVANLPRTSGSAGDLAPVIRRRPTASRVLSVLPAEPAPRGAAIGSPDGVPSFALPASLPASLPPMAAPAAAPAVVPAALPPVKVPAKEAGGHGGGLLGDEEECPGGVCRVPGT